MTTAPGTEQQQNVQRGLEYLKGSDQIIGDIVAYCVNAYKADPQTKTLERTRQYVQDTANSVSEHILNIAHNLSKILEQETKEIEQLSYDAGFVAHRMQTSQSYMCELFMTKFQVYPRPRKTVHMTRKTIPEDQLPKHSRPKRWVREKAFDYTILDGISDEKPVSTPAKTSTAGESVAQLPYIPIVSAPAPFGFPPPLSQMDLSKRDEPPPSIPTVPKSTPVKTAPPTLTTPPVVPSVPPVPTIPAVPRSNGGPPIPPVPSSSGNVPPVPPVPLTRAGGGATAEPPDELKPFLKMLKVGVPRPSVESKMQQAGLDPALLDQFLDGNQSKPAGESSAPRRPPNPMVAALNSRNGPPPPQASGGGVPPPLPPIPRPST
jgi:hypothetical protein